MPIWKTDFTLETLHSLSRNTLGETIGIEFTEIGEDFIRARMPVDSRTVQPFRMLHGGASVVLSETLGSLAGQLCVEDPEKQACVGIEVNANHLRPAFEGSFVVGTVRPVHIGKTLMVWNTEIHDERGKLVCISRLTVQVIKRG